MKRSANARVAIESRNEEPYSEGAGLPRPTRATVSMRRAAVLPALWLSVACAARAAVPPGDEAAIREVATRQGEAWNRHDAKAYAALFTEDCDVVNVQDWWWRERAELESKLTAAFAYVFRESRLTITEVHVRSLSPAIALAHARWTMTGARTPPGMPEPRAGIQTLVFRKQAGRWLISGFQNTNAVPEQPFPPAASPTPGRPEP